MRAQTGKVSLVQPAVAPQSLVAERRRLGLDQKDELWGQDGRHHLAALPVEIWEAGGKLSVRTQFGFTEI